MGEKRQKDQKYGGKPRKPPSPTQRLLLPCLKNNIKNKSQLG